MSDTNNACGILQAIQLIASNHETGQLEIGSSGCQGTLNFSKGKLVDATLGSLSGFQAVNAAVSMRDVQFRFNPLTSIPRPGSIAPSERFVLQRFFGIEAADTTADESESVDWNTTPHQVVPLAELEDVEQFDLPETPTVEARPVVAPVVEQSVARPDTGSRLSDTTFIKETAEEKYGQEFVAPEAISETTTIGNPVPQSIISAHSNRSSLRWPIALTMMLLLILAAAAIALIPKLKAHRDVASVSSGQPSATPGESVPGIEREPEQQVNKTSSTSVAEKQSHIVARTTQPAESTPHDRDVQDLTGEWQVINTIDKTAYNSFQNMQVGFRLRIVQNGNEFTASGEKISENGRALPARSRTPITVKGSIAGDKVVATFIEEGLVRRTNGRFNWSLQDDHDALTGTFISAAANSSGKSGATRHP